MSGTKKYVTNMPASPQMAAMIKVHLVILSGQGFRANNETTHFLPRVRWIGVKACVPMAAPVFPIAADMP